MNSNFNIVFKTLLPFGFILAFSYFLTVLLFLYLPKDGVESSAVVALKMSNKRYDFVKAFDLKQKAVAKKKSIVKKKEYQLLSNIELNAVYASSNDSGWVVVKEKSSSKTHILAKGDQFKNYNLTKILKSYVIFERNTVEYKLQMNTKKLKYEVLTKKEETKNKMKKENKQKQFKQVKFKPNDIKPSDMTNITKLGVQ